MTSAFMAATAVTTAMEFTTTAAAEFTATAAAETMGTITVPSASFLETTVASTESAITFSEATVASTELMTAAEALESARVVASVEFRMPVIKLIPGTGADEHAAGEPFRTPITIRRAPEGIIRVKPVRAYRGSIVKAVFGTYLNANCNLGVRIDRRQC